MTQSSDTPIISVRNLSKTYQIGVSREKYKRLSETITDAVLHLGWLLSSQISTRETFYALKDISFDVWLGEDVGIIGRNGAGKSTLLEILSGITLPSTGEIELNGRVGSLLEVGTGFHPELTGRKNIYFNGSILGMTRREIDDKFDDIVKFAGIEEFLDTPVKRYSSGMSVRLGYAVAAHLDPEILVVDEVLAVGDVQFQKKCPGKMKEESEGGRTVLFVSHNIGVMSQLCIRGIWIEKGLIEDIDEIGAIISKYIESNDNSYSSPASTFKEDLSKEVQLLKASIQDRNGNITQSFSCDDPIIVSFHLSVREEVPGLYGYMDVMRSDGTRVMMSDSFDSPPNPLDNLHIGDYSITITIPPRILGPGDYCIYLNFTSDRANTWNVDSPGIVTSFSMSDYTSKRGNQRTGFFSNLPEWKTIPFNRSKKGG